MSIGPIIQGSTRPPWTFSILQDDNRPFILTGATFTGVLFDRETSNPLVLGGTFTITSPTLGTFTYTPIGIDVAEAGEFELEFAITILGSRTFVRDHITILERYGA